MVEHELNVTVDLSIKDKNWTLQLMDAIFGDNLGIRDDYEYAIGVLLSYATDDSDAKAIEALEEVVNTLGYELTEK